MSKAKPLFNVDEILSPEGVPLRLNIAGIGVRLGAQITDILLTVVAATCIVILLAVLDFTTPQTLFAVTVMLLFLIRVPYYVVAELAWNGQTLGKRLLKLKVVSHDGTSLTTHAVVLRNLMKEAEVFLPATLLLTLDESAPVYSILALIWVGFTLLVPLRDKYRRRLGDIMAGTHVVHLPEPVLLPDLARAKPAPKKAKGFAFLPHQLDHYGAYELQTLEDLMRADGRHGQGEQAKRIAATRAAVIDRIRHKIGFADPIPPEDHVAFLQAFYNAQRAHLEQRQLFGDRRADKHHGSNGKSG